MENEACGQCLDCFLRQGCDFAHLGKACRYWQLDRSVHE